MVNEGKVLKILDSYTIVVSLGRAEVNEGDRLVVYGVGDEISNDKGESLGRLEIVKANLEVEHVQDRFSTAISPIKTETVRETVPSISSGSYLSSWSTIFGGTVNVERAMPRRYREPLPIDDKPAGLDRKIRVGDLVRKIT